MLKKFTRTCLFDWTFYYLRIASYEMKKFLTIILVCGLCRWTVSKDTKGRHFVVTVPPTFGLREFNCLLYITSDREGHVIIKKHVSQVVTLVGNYNISQGGFSVNIKGSTIQQSDYGRQTKALVVTADVDVAVYVAADVSDTPAMFTALPTSLASTSYGILLYVPIGYFNYVLVTSLKDDTHVYVSNFAFGTTSVTLNYMESYSFRSTSDSSGAIVTSDSPVNVVAGSTCSNIPMFIRNCDTIYDSPIPIAFWGKHFIIPPLYPRTGYIIRILARTKTTGVSFQYQTSESRETKSKVFTGMQELQLGNSTTVIRANTTVTIVQYGLGQEFDFTEGDPFMSSVPSVNHFSNNYTFPSPMSNKGLTNRIAITIEEKYMNELKLDGRNVISITSCITMTVPEPFDHYRVLILELIDGYHHLKHSKSDAKYSVLLYGLKRGAGFGFSLGFSFDIKECSSSPCQNNANCTDNIDGYQCTCMPGYTGINCETDTDECQSSPCLNGATCVDGKNGYTCSCGAGYNGCNCATDIQECESSPCRNYGSCTDIVNGYTCSCQKGYSGGNCEIDINECESSSCQNGATCIDGIHGYTCSCMDGYSGETCITDIDECRSSPCQNEAICTDSINGYNCTCVAGYSGVHCEFDVDECSSLPCKNGAQCTDDINGYTCTCMSGYTGVNCELETDECVSSPCQNDATCTDHSNGYKCSCLAGYGGVNCETDIDECQSSPCQHYATCTDIVNGYACSCRLGYSGTNCETEINKCDSSPCQNGGKCIKKFNGYSCRCGGGYDGINCEQDIDECLSSPCQNKANCAQGINIYTCSCTTGYTGFNCEFEKDECTSNPCQNGAHCGDRISGYVCTCETGYAGINCERNTDNLLVDKSSKYTSTVIGYAVLGLIIIILVVYATYRTIVHWKMVPVRETSSQVKTENNTTEEEDTSHFKQICMNMMDIHEQNSPDNMPLNRTDVGTADEHYSYTMTDECRGGDKANNKYPTGRATYQESNV